MSWEKGNETRGHFQQDYGNEEKMEWPDLLDQQGGCGPADDRAQRPSHPDECEQPLALVGVENIGHEGPEDRDHKKIEDTDPNEEGTADPDLRARRRKLHQEIEENQVRDEEPGNDREETPPREVGEGGRRKGRCPGAPPSWSRYTSRKAFRGRRPRRCRPGSGAKRNSCPGR